jgi:hypothetical protein
MSQSTSWRITVLTVVCGAVICAGIALLISGNFVAATVLEIDPGGSGAGRWQRLAQERVFGPASLAAVIQRLDLYPAERARLPLEDVIETMRQAVKVTPLDGPSLLRVSFEYSDSRRAEATVAMLRVRLAQEIARIALDDGTLVSVRAVPVADPVRREYLANVYDPADLEMAAIGASACVLAGVLLFGRTRRRVGTMGAVLAAASGGAIVAGAIAFAMPQQYVSRTTLRTVSQLPPHKSAVSRIGELSERVLSRSSLTEIIQRPSVDLYRAERSRRSMEQVVERMRRDLTIEPVFEGGPDASLAVVFRYSDPAKAQAALHEIVTRYMEANVRISQQASEGPGAPGSMNLVVMNPPSKPESPVGPNKLLWMAEGAGAGLTILLLVRLIGLLARPRRRLMLRLGLGAGAAAAVVAAVAAFASPARYLSTATVRMVNSSDAANDLQTRLGQVVGSTTLVELMQRPDLNLYAKERSQLPVKDVLRQLRTRDLCIETLKVSEVGRTQSLRIAFQYPDREKAHGFVQALVSKLVEGDGIGDARAYVEVLDPPSVPEAPQLPDRATIIAVGLIAGVLLGSAAILLGRSRAAVPAV